MRRPAHCRIGVKDLGRERQGAAIAPTTNRRALSRKDLIAHVLDCLPSRPDDRAFWVTVGMAIHASLRLKLGFPVWDEWSSKVP